MIIGIGVDIVEIPRIREMRTRQGERFNQLVFTPAEIAYCLRRKNADQHFAARFAAKEAVMKALHTGWDHGVSFKRIEVLRGDEGPPAIKLHDRAALLAEELGVGRIHLSLTHSEKYAVAQVVIESK